MNEIDYIGPTNINLSHGNRIPNYVIAGIVEDYVNGCPPLWVIAEKYAVGVNTVSAHIDIVLFNKPEIPVMICLKSAV
jgi:hypothetical protein